MLKKVLVFMVLYIVWIMLALFVMMSLFVNQETSTLNPLGCVFYAALIMPPVWLFQKWVNAAPRWEKKVETEGVQAPATIVSVKDTGMVINNTISVIRLRLRVEPPGEAPFEVSQEKEISLLSGLSGYGYYEGAHVQVKYDPANKKHVAILSGSAAAPGHEARLKITTAHKQKHSHTSADSDHTGLSKHERNLSSTAFAQELSERAAPQSQVSGAVLADELAKLSELHSRGDLSDAEFDAAKKKLLG